MKRVVKLDGTITLDKKLYEVPAAFIGQKIDLRLDDQTVYVFKDGKKVAQAIAVQMEDNAHVKRTPSPFATMETVQQKGETDHV